MLIIILVIISVLLLSSVILNILLLRSLRIQLKKIALYEEWIVEYEQWTRDVRTLVSDTYIRMKEVDHKNLFFKDDDVGFVFSNLLNLLKDLNDRIQE